MTTFKIEEFINFKFLVTLRESPTECFQLLKKIFQNNCMSHTQVFEEHKRFLEGRDECSGRSVTSRTDEKNKTLNESVRVWMKVDMTNINRETVRTILHEDMQLTKVCANMVQTYLTQEQKLNNKNIRSDVLDRFTEAVNNSLHMMKRGFSV